MKHVQTEQAPAAIGAYSQAVQCDGLIFISGQIPLKKDGTLAGGAPREQIELIFSNLLAIAKAGGAEGYEDFVKVNVFLTDLEGWFKEVNQVMESLFEPPYPARAVVGVNSLPKGVLVEIEAVVAAGRQD